MCVYDPFLLLRHVWFLPRHAYRKVSAPGANRILTPLYSNKMWRHVTSIWPYGITWTRTIHGVGSFFYEPVASCRADGRRYRQPLTPGDILWSYSYMKAKCLAQPQRRSSSELRLRITGAWLHFAQSLEQVGLRYRLLPCDMQSAYSVSVRCVRNFWMC